MKIDLNKTKHRALLLSPAFLAILFLAYAFLSMLFKFKPHPFAMPIYIVIMIYTGTASLILFIHDTRRDNKEFKRKFPN